MPRLFVAVWPPQDVLDRLAILPRPQIEGIRWTAREQWHVTLRFLGAVPDVGPVAGALSAIGLVATRAAVGPAVDRFGQRIVHVPVTGLDETAAAVVGATGHLGKPPDDRPFHGHVTLARVAKHARVDLRALTGTRVQGEWEVDSVALVESRISRAGARYEVLERFPGPTSRSRPGDENPCTRG